MDVVIIMLFPGQLKDKAKIVSRCIILSYAITETTILKNKLRKVHAHT